jgi:flagellar biosynthesis/type III secretory pathway protein FliH
MTETHIAGELYGLSAHPGDIYHRAAMTVEALTRERDEALAEAALSEKSYEEAYGEAYDEGLQEGLSGAASAASDLWSMLLRHFHKYGVEPASDDGEGHSAYQMMDALHEHEREVDMAHKAEVERLTRERDEARAAALEEAALVFDDAAVGHLRVADMHNRDGYARGMELALLVAKNAEKAAAAIRALKEPVASLRVAGLAKLNCANLEGREHD